MTRPYCPNGMLSAVPEYWSGTLVCVLFSTTGRFETVGDSGWVEILDRWRLACLPEGFPIAAGEASVAEPLDEAISRFRSLLPPRVSMRRQATFAMGRLAAERAARGLGHELRHLPRGDLGEPKWPDGLIGSIAHIDDTGIAVVASDDIVAAIGLDMERAGSGSEIEELVAFDSEIEWLEGGDRESRTMEIFSAKEAIYKALFPYVGGHFGFDAVRLEADEDRGGFRARLVVELPGLETLTTGFRVANTWRGGVVFSWILIKSSEWPIRETA